MFYYLPRHGTGMLKMDLTDPHYPSDWISVQGLAWDGKYWVVEGDDYYLDRFTINVTAVFVDATQIMPTGRYQGPIAFYRKNSKARASQVVAESMTVDRKGYAIDYWLYPAGGASVHDVTHDLTEPYGVAISLGKP